MVCALKDGHSNWRGWGGLENSEDQCYSRSSCVMLQTLSLPGKVKPMVSLENNTRHGSLSEIEHRPKHKRENYKPSQRKQTFVKNCDAYVHDEY